MKGLRLVGDYLFEYFVLTLLLAVSAALVIPFIPVFVGIVGYFQRDINSRRFKDIFTTIGKNWKILIGYTIFELAMLAFSCLNIFYFNTRTEGFNKVVLFISWVLLVLAGIYLVHSPVIIVKMNVSFFQLLANGIVLTLGGWWRSILSLGVVAGIIALIKFFPYAILPAMYFVPLIICKLLTENFFVLKAKALKIPVYKLKQMEASDNYLDENGNVDHSDEDDLLPESEVKEDHTEENDET